MGFCRMPREQAEQPARDAVRSVGVCRKQPRVGQLFLLRGLQGPPWKSPSNTCETWCRRMHQRSGVDHGALPSSRRLIPTDQSLCFASSHRATARMANEVAGDESRNEGDRPDDEDEEYFERADASHVTPVLVETQTFYRTRPSIDRHVCLLEGPAECFRAQRLKVVGCVARSHEPPSLDLLRNRRHT